MKVSEESLRSTLQDELDLRGLFSILFEGRLIVGAAVVTAAIVSVLIALWLPNIYRAEALLTANQRDSAQGLSGIAAQYGGLASLAGVSLAEKSSDPVAVGIEILKSRKFLAEFIERHDLLVPLIAGTGWNEESDRLEIDAKVYDEERQKWVRPEDPPRKVVPTLQEGSEELRKRMSVVYDVADGFVTVAVEFYSPEIARQWVDWLVADLNNTVMERDVGEAERAISYLKAQIDATPIAELHNVFFRLIEEKTKTVMLAKVSDEYLLKTIDPAVAPERKARPKRAMIVLLGSLLGGILGCLVVLAVRPQRV